MDDVRDVPPAVPDVTPRIIRPDLAEDEFARLSAHRSWPAWLWGRPATFERTDLIYLPYHEWQFTVAGGGRRGALSVTVECVTGNAATRSFAALPRWDTPPTTILPAQLSLADTRRLADETLRWAIIPQSMRRRRRIQTIGEPVLAVYLYPFRVGYYRRRGGYDFTLVDAVSGAIHGTRLRRVFLEGLTALDRLTGRGTYYEEQ